MLEGVSDINYYASKIIGVTNSVHKGSNGELYDNKGRYWVAVGPDVMDPSFPDNRAVKAEDMKYGTEIDVVIQDNSGINYYIYAVVGDAKVHTYPNGIYKIGKAYPNGTDYHPNNVDGSIIEFMGKAPITGLTNYKIIKIIVYD